MSQENEIIRLRRERLNVWKERGANPYPNNLRPKDLASGVAKEYSSWAGDALANVTQQFSLAGRLMARRTFGKAGFLQLRDRSGMFQIYADKQHLSTEDFEAFQSLQVGDIFYVEGTLFRTKTGELTLHARQLKYVVPTILPLPEKWHGLTDVETRYRQRYVDLIANSEIQDVFRKRARMIQALRDFLVQRDFIEVETPMMHPIPGGATAKPFVTHHNALDQQLYLRIAPELYLKKLVVGGFERIFEVNRNFRNEGISTQHNPEFTSLELYQAYADFEDLMHLTESMLSTLALAVSGQTVIDYQNVSIEWAGPYARYRLDESLVKVAGLSEAVVRDEREMRQMAKSWAKPAIIDRMGLGALQTLAFEELVEKKLMQPTFITHFPTEVSPLARRNDTDPSVTDRFELYVYGRELVNAFSELNDPIDQRERFEAQVKARDAGDEEAMFLDEDFITALEYGMPPTAGLGLGIDRLAMFFTNAASIRDVLFFPQLKTPVS